MLTAARQPRFARFICDNLSLITLRIFYLTAWRARHISRPASLIEGRLRRRSRWRSEAWCPAAAARNRQPREARDPVRQALRPGREELAARIRRKCRRWKHGPRPKIATVERREARVPPLGDDKAPRKRLACRVMARRGCRCTRAPSRRSATPRRVDEREGSNPGRHASRERE